MRKTDWRPFAALMIAAALVRFATIDVQSYWFDEALTAKLLRLPLGDMLSQLPRDRIDAIIESLPVPRYAQPDDIFNVLDFFASDRSSYITAQTVFLGGVN